MTSTAIPPPPPPPPSCCPPGAVPSASAQQAGATEPTLGEVIHLPNPKTGQIIATYSVLPPKGKPIIGAVLMFHDIFGFDSGRTHHVADGFASQGYFVVSPDWLGPELASKEMMEKIKYPWKAIEQKLVDVVLPYVRSKTDKICLLGFCWGGWAAMRAAGSSTMKATGLPDNLFLCGASPHPSLQCQTRQAEGPTLEEMIRDTSCPFFLAPAGEDPVDSRDDGSWIRILRENPRSKNSFAVLYANQTHGWSVRGDIRDPKIKVDVDDVFAKTLAFFNKCVGAAL